MEKNAEYKINFTKKALKHLDKISKNKILTKKVGALLNQIAVFGPEVFPPKFEKLQGDYKEFYSRRITDKDRLVYKVENDTIIVYSLLTHYEDL